MLVEGITKLNWGFATVVVGLCFLFYLQEPSLWLQVVFALLSCALCMI